MPNNNNDVEEQLLECVDKGLDSLGQQTKRVIFWHLERRWGIKREEIPRRLKDFVSALYSMFGTGARYIEKAIIREMNARMGVSADYDSLLEAAREVMAPESRPA